LSNHINRVFEKLKQKAQMRKHIVAFGRELPESLVDSLQEEFEVTVISQPKLEKAAFAKNIQNAHGLIGASVKLQPELLDAARNLEIISSVSVGYDNYDLEYLSRRGILLTNTPDVLTETTADTAFALVMATARRVVELAEYVKEGRWQQSIDRFLFGTDIHGKRLGIIGYGRIGQAIARRGHFGFDMQIAYWNRRPKAEAETLKARFCRLDELLREADFLCVTVPLTAETDHLIGAREFALMRPNAIFINVARGRVVDEKALISALQQGQIRAAGLDVFEQEPLAADSPLLTMSNVVATPHIGSATQETRRAMAELAVKNLRAGLRGERPADLVNPSVWESSR
jgi:phosphogluconate 2-dehydrogenase